MTEKTIENRIVELDMGQGGKKMDILLDFITDRIEIKKIPRGIGVESGPTDAASFLPDSQRWRS